MGKASRKKQERKVERTLRIALGLAHQSELTTVAAKKLARQAAGNSLAPLSELFDQFKGEKLIVIDCNGVARGEQDSRQMYWEDVSNSLFERRATCLPEMKALGSLLNFSIFDVKIPVTYQATGERVEENIFSAAFLLDYVDCFQWLLSEALPGGCDHSLLGSVFKDIVSIVPRLEIESPKMAMANIMGKFMCEWFHQVGWLEPAMADTNRTMGQPFTRQIAQDYLASLAADKEGAALDAYIPDPGCEFEPNPRSIEAGDAVVERARAGSQSLRI